MTSGASPAQQACVYFFVNRGEVDRWFLRTCELRTLAFAAAQLPHHAVNAAQMWLKQLLTALRQFAAANKAETAAKGKSVEQAASASARQRHAGKHNGTTADHRHDSKAGKHSSAAQSQPLTTPVRILQPSSAQRESTLPRSVVKLPYQRRGSPGDSAAATQSQHQAEPSAAQRATASVDPAAAQAQTLPRQASSPLQMPRRLVSAMVQLMQVLTESLLALRASDELVRLHNVCTASLTPVLAHLMMQPSSDGAKSSADGTESADGEPPSLSALAPTASAAADKLLAFVRAAACQVEGRFEGALEQYAIAGAAARWVPAIAAEHAAFCQRRAAACYAALSDWVGLQDCKLPEQTVVSSGVRRRAELQNMQVWAPADSLIDEEPSLPDPVTPAPVSAQMSALLDGGLASAAAALQQLYPFPAATATRSSTGPAIQRLHSDMSRALGAMRSTAHCRRGVASTELLAVAHISAASSQLLAARMPPATAVKLPPGCLGAACARQDVCKNLLDASELLDGSAIPHHGLLSAAMLSVQSDPLAEHLSAASTLQHEPGASQLPLRLHTFEAASLLASAREYTFAGAGGSLAALPPKADALQVPFCLVFLLLYI